MRSCRWLPTGNVRSTSRSEEAGPFEALATAFNVAAVGWDGVYLDQCTEVFPESRKRLLERITTRFDVDGDGVADDLATLDLQYETWRPYFTARLREELAAVIETVVADKLPYAPDGAAACASDAVGDFFALYPQRPVTDNKGGSGFNDSLWIYALARAFVPRLIIESAKKRKNTSKKS